MDFGEANRLAETARLMEERAVRWKNELEALRAKTAKLEAGQEELTSRLADAKAVYEGELEAFVAEEGRPISTTRTSATLHKLPDFSACIMREVEKLDAALSATRKEEIALQSRVVDDVCAAKGSAFGHFKVEYGELSRQLWQAYEEAVAKVRQERKRDRVPEWVRCRDDTQR